MGFEQYVDLQSVVRNTAQKSLADINFYVNAATGNDNNSGLTTGTAFKTIQKAINSLPQIVNFNATINIADGTYAEDVTVMSLMGGGNFFLVGNTVTPANVLVQSIDCNKTFLRTDFKGFKRITGTAKTTFLKVANSAPTLIEDVVSDILDTKVGVVVSSGIGTVRRTTISNGDAGIVAEMGAIIWSENNGGTGNTTGLIARAGAKIGKSGTQPAGTTAEGISMGGQIL